MLEWSAFIKITSEKQRESLILFLAACVFNPLFWNVTARLEFYFKLLTRTVGFGSRRGACYWLALTIFLLGLGRDYLYKCALDEQPSIVSTPYNDYHFRLFFAGNYAVPIAVMMKLAGLVCFVFGNILVLSSMWRLGITGTYLGDYFGILMSSRVTEFPFNFMDNPMYNGSTLVFLGTGLWELKLAALPLSLFVFTVYQIALMFEGPFTARIYAKAASKDTSKPSSNRRTSPRSTKKQE